MSDKLQDENSSSRNISVTQDPPKKAKVEEVTSSEFRPKADRERPLEYREPQNTLNVQAVEDVRALLQTNTEPLKLSTDNQSISDELPSGETTTADRKGETSAPDHNLWDELLNKYVTASGEVDYQGMASNTDQLNQYLDLLSKNPVQSNWGRNEKLAYWINAYNAFTVKLIVNNLPVKSIRDLKNPWDQKFIQLGDDSFSLNQIEHEIIRPQFKEPRIHFAVVCAAVSCPKLRNEAFTSNKLDEQLNAQTRYFINDSGKNQISSSKIAVSQLFKWYGEDFTSAGSLVDFLNQYSDQKINSDASVTFAEYDWSLNN